MRSLAGIVLAAGQGQRMGRAKALLEFAGAALVEQHVARLAEIGCEAIAVVVRPDDAEQVRGLLRRQRAARVEGVGTASQAESLAAGLRLLGCFGSTPQDVIIVTPVDMLPAQARTHHALLASLDEALLAVTPTYAGRGGHPVIARRALLAAYEAAPAGKFPQPCLRQVLASAQDARRRVEVDDPRVLGDLDTPEDLRAWANSG